MKYALRIYDRPNTYDDLPESERDAAFAEYRALSSDPRVVGGAH